MNQSVDGRVELMQRRQRCLATHTSCIWRVGVTLGKRMASFLTVGAAAVVNEGVDVVAVAVAVEIAMETT